MTKEQVKKHGETIKWFCDNSEKGIWEIDHPEDNWELIYDPAFYSASMYVQNDEYAEFRKAQADGKIVEYRFEFNTRTERDCWSIHNGDFHGGAGCYRIKPNEPKLQLYNLSEIPKQVCFSTKGMSGSYYIELEGGHHCYDEDGNYQKSFSAIPKDGRMWYLSNKKGLPLDGLNRPNFKAGDKILELSTGNIYTIYWYFEKTKVYRLDNTCGLVSFRLDEEDLFELYTPKFKVGDWVVNTTTTKPYKPYIFESNREVTLPAYSHIELWEPKKGEWVVYWNSENPELYGISRFQACFNWNHVAPVVEFTKTLT